MKRIFLIIAVFMYMQTSAQEITKVSLQASGLTCSLCSNAINKALKSLDFVDKVDANIKNSSFDIYFKPGAKVDFDRLRAKVEDAGFSVANFTANIHFNQVKMLNDYCVVLGETAFQFINAKDQVLNGDKMIRVLDKGFVLAKEYKKNSNLLTKGACYERIGQTTVTKHYHVTI